MKTTPIPANRFLDYLSKLRGMVRAPDGQLMEDRIRVVSGFLMSKRSRENLSRGPVMMSDNHMKIVREMEKPDDCPEWKWQTLCRVINAWTAGDLTWEHVEVAALVLENTGDPRIRKNPWRWVRNLKRSLSYGRMSLPMRWHPFPEMLPKPGRYLVLAWNGIVMTDTWYMNPCCWSLHRPSAILAWAEIPGIGKKQKAGRSRLLNLCKEQEAFWANTEICPQCLHQRICSDAVWTCAKCGRTDDLKLPQVSV